MIDQYITNLRQFRAIGFDAGNEEQGIAPTVTELHRLLDTYRMAHFYEIYDGNHANRVAARIETKMLPFFTANLNFGPQ